MPPLQIRTTPIPELGGAPVGTIIAVAGQFGAIPRGWQPCNGNPITDPASPLRGQNTPT
jgi:hypothetical protein